MSVEFNPSRRRFLGMSSRAILGTELFALSAREGVVSLHNELDLQKQAAKDSRLPNSEFIQKYKLKNTEIGCSFSPEMFGLSMEQLKDDPALYAQNKALAMRSLQFAVKEMGGKNVRLGVRWDQCVDENGLFDFSQYEWLLDEAFNLGAQVTLNTGPTKTFRWKEDFVPQSVLEKMSQVPPKGYVIGVNSELAKYGVEHAYQLLDHIGALYGDTKQIVGIQPQNEGFFPFGENEWTVSPEYMQRHMEIIHEMFPDKTILLNSAGSHNVKEIQRVFENMRLEHKDVKLCMGVDFHPYKPHMIIVPKLGLIDDFTQGIIKDFGYDVFSDNEKMARKIGYEREGTEIQGEPWNSETRPGNDVSVYKYTLARFIQKMPPTPQSRMILRYWGVEHLSSVFERAEDTAEHREILKLNQSINFS